MMRPLFKPDFLMEAQIFFVTSVRGNFFAPQIATMSALRTFGAKMPFPAFFIASAFFVAFKDALVAFVTVVFVVVVATVVFVVVVIAIGGRKCAHALSLE